ncbi:D-beta-hydroxybutyrate dehydrogenase, mitochondrial-like [Anopheles bellator]|uniref:D-beta-hydroxybutyrate dehydrogenase, mitochondrial-like n=1 Tax=Anopheles bellator TaxID=139047 RepID=UPI00264971FB|nr:D-beta-hydroxybutyrate dehydrogenase, mitochondrial-like [Anopheles bellator]
MLFTVLCGLASLVAAIALAAGKYSVRRSRKNVIASLNQQHVVIITGCDSGLGFNLARTCLQASMTVIATFVNENSEGRRKLMEMSESGGRLKPLVLDLTDTLSIYTAQDAVQHLFETDLRDSQLYAIVNNSAVMCFGEAEWQSTALIAEQVSVNLTGPLLFTISLLDMLRKDRGRLVVVTSHCGQQALPGLSVYSATKAALHAWCTAVRLELAPHHTPVVELVPGSFLLHSNICARQEQFFDDMWSTMTVSQQMYYGTYFQEYRDYLAPLCRPRPVEPFPSEDPLLECIHGALFDKRPKAIYKCESWRYWVYYTAFAFTPSFVRDKLIRRFLAMPEYNGSNPQAKRSGTRK